MRPTTVLAPGTWSAEPSRSAVRFAVERGPSGALRGRFDRVDARLAVGRDGRAGLLGSVRTASLVLADADGRAHAAAAEALDAARFPEIRFASSALDAFGDLVQVDGQLTIKATTLSVTAAGRLAEEDGGSSLVLTLETLVDLRQFGVGASRPVRGDQVELGHETRLEAELVLRRRWVR